MNKGRVTLFAIFSLIIILSSIYSQATPPRCGNGSSFVLVEYEGKNYSNNSIEMQVGSYATIYIDCSIKLPFYTDATNHITDEIKSPNYLFEEIRPKVYEFRPQQQNDYNLIVECPEKQCLDSTTFEVHSGSQIRQNKLAEEANILANESLNQSKEANVLANKSLNLSETANTISQEAKQNSFWGILASIVLAAVGVVKLSNYWKQRDRPIEKNSIQDEKSEKKEGG